jgi:small subunit ribosomal protein S7
MSRRRTATKRTIEADFLYGELDVAKLINYVMRKGKKDIARKIVYNAFEKVAKKTNQDPLIIFKEGLENARPLMQVKSRRVGGATYPVPMEVNKDRSKSLALRWMVGAIKERALKNAEDDLAQVLVDSANKTGFAVGKKIEMHRQAEANKAFAHFRW